MKKKNKVKDSKTNLSQFQRKDSNWNVHKSINDFIEKTRNIGGPPYCQHIRQSIHSNWHWKIVMKPFKVWHLSAIMNLSELNEKNDNLMKKRRKKDIELGEVRQNAGCTMQHIWFCLRISIISRNFTNLSIRISRMRC